jgi:PAS domain S-box-containing protein
MRKRTVNIAKRNKETASQESRFKALIENAFDGIIMESTRESIYAVDKQLRYIAFNRNHAIIMQNVYGASIELGNAIHDYLIGYSEHVWIRSELRRALKGELFSSERQINRPHYADRYIETTYNPIFDKKKKVIGAAVFVRDITQRKKSEEKLRVLNDGLISQNWQLAQQEAELKIILEELSERNFELDQLMYKTSHDLRSPLSSILGLINLAHLEKNKENYPGYFTKIEGRVKKLDEFIRSMLNYARVNRSEVVREQINIAELINGCIHELEYLDNFTKVKTQVAIKNEESLFMSDALRVKIILSNIISNAYKYYNAANRSYLKINVKVTPFVLEMEFHDNGIGIKKEYVKKVFDMFYRATEKSQGSGLGMYIVKQAVDKLKGSIKVKSTFGKGTTIKITLPNN